MLTTKKRISNCSASQSSDLHRTRPMSTVPESLPFLRFRRWHARGRCRKEGGFLGLEFGNRCGTSLWQDAARSLCNRPISSYRNEFIYSRELLQGSAKLLLEAIADWHNRQKSRRPFPSSGAFFFPLELAVDKPTIGATMCHKGQIPQREHAILQCLVRRFNVQNRTPFIGLCCYSWIRIRKDSSNICYNFSVIVLRSVQTQPNDDCILLRYDRDELSSMASSRESLVMQHL